MSKLVGLILSLSLSVFYSCGGQEKKTDQNKYEFIDILTQDDLALLKGVNIGVRKQGAPAYSFSILIDTVKHHIPEYDTFKTREAIMNPEWYDVKKFAAVNGMDSVKAYEYVKAYSDKVIAAFNKAKVMGIKNDPSLGDFIIFKVVAYENYPSEDVIYLFPDGKVYHDYWKDFFVKAEKIKDRWYTNKN